MVIVNGKTVYQCFSHARHGAFSFHRWGAQVINIEFQSACATMKLMPQNAISPRANLVFLACFQVRFGFQFRAEYACGAIDQGRRAPHQ